MFYPGHFSVNKHFRNAGPFDSVSADISIMQRLNHVSKYQILVVFWAFVIFNILFKNCSISYIIANAFFYNSLDLHMRSLCIICISCGRHILFSFVPASARPSVRVTLPLTEPYLQEPFVHSKVEIVFIINIPTEVVQQNIKIKFWPKTLFEFVFCPGQLSVTINGRETGIFLILTKTFPCCHFTVNISKCQILFF